MPVPYSRKQVPAKISTNEALNFLINKRNATIFMRNFRIFPFQECSFNKLHSNTALKVSYQGNIRVESDATCNRWYFKFNGNECSGPMTIDSVLYTNWAGGTSNILRHHSFEGYCENLARGTVRVELWVGKCHRETQGNAYTGWNSVSRIMIEEVPPSQ